MVSCAAPGLRVLSGFLEDEAETVSLLQLF
jgi:hypothetical protein